MAFGEDSYFFLFPVELQTFETNLNFSLLDFNLGLHYLAAIQASIVSNQAISCGSAGDRVSFVDMEAYVIVLCFIEKIFCFHSL